MAGVKTPIGSTLPSTGDTLTPGVWHAMIDGLEANQFGVSDFFNGDARVIMRTSDASDPPAWVQGQVWSDPSEISHIYSDSTISLSLALLSDRTELVVWVETAVSLGAPLYMEGMRLDGDWAVPKATPIVTARSVPWAPAFGLALESTPGSEYIAVGIEGLMQAWTDDSQISFGDGLFYSTTDEEVAKAEPGNLFFASPTNGFKTGVWVETDNSSGTRLLRCWKKHTASSEDRT